MVRARTEEEATREAEDIVLEHINDIPLRLKVNYSLDHIVGAINVARADLLARSLNW